MGDWRGSVRLDLESRNRIAITELEHQPFFKDLLEFLATHFKVLAICPDTFEARNLAEEGPVVEEFVPGLLKLCCHVLTEHGIDSVPRPLIDARPKPSLATTSGISN